MICEYCTSHKRPVICRTLCRRSVVSKCEGPHSICGTCLPKLLFDEEWKWTDGLPSGVVVEVLDEPAVALAIMSRS